MKEGRLGYNYKNDRYGILNFDLWEDDGLHCGETFEVYLNGEWVQDRIEMSGTQWYLVYSNLKGADLEGIKVKIK